MKDMSFKREILKLYTFLLFILNQCHNMNENFNAHILDVEEKLINSEFEIFGGQSIMCFY